MTPKQARVVVAITLIALAFFLYRTVPPPEPAPGASPEASASASAAPEPVNPLAVADPKNPGPRDFWVAKQTLDPALVITVTPEMVELRTMPDSVPVPDASLCVKSLDQIETKILVAPIVQGEILLRSRFSDARREAQQKKLRDVIANGTRAISLDLDAVTSASGFIAQGDWVDVIATYTFAGKQLTRTIIQNVEVLARGTEYRSTDRPTGERLVRGDSGGAIIFTLKVTPQMAIKLAHLVEERGFNRFRLALKNRDDRVPYFSRGTRLSQVLDDLPTQASVDASNDPTEIEIYRGGSITKEGSEVRPAGPGAAKGKKKGPMSLDDFADSVGAVKGEAPISGNISGGEPAAPAAPEPPAPYGEGGPIQPD